MTKDTDWNPENFTMTFTVLMGSFTFYVFIDPIENKIFFPYF